MPHLDPTWQAAALVALCLVLLTAVTRRAGWSRSGAALSEASLVVGLYATWQLLGRLTHRSAAGAHDRALQVWHLEQALHLPSEVALQAGVLPHPSLVQLANGYYLYGHFNPLIALLVWVWVRHRGAYPRVRLLLALLTASAFVLHAITVAPPRLVPELGFRDVALEYGQSVYGGFSDGLSGQLLAMPSLHVGWAVLVAYVVVTTSRSRWRWLAVAHPVLMSLVVVVTANHWWLDGIVCTALLAAIVRADAAVRRARTDAVAPALPERLPARTLRS